MMRKIDVISFVGEDFYSSQAPEALLREMDRNHVERTMIAPVEKYTAVYNEEGNRMVADICRRWPDRFLGYAVCSPWRGKQGERELKRALEDGLTAVYFNSAVQGFTISDDIVDPLIAVCAEYQVPVYFHTGTPAYALPFQLHFLAERFPEVMFIMGHNGANDFSGDALPAVWGSPNILLDTSLNLGVSIRALAKSEPDKVVFGSAAPRSRLGYEIQRVEEGIKDMETLEKVFSGNILKILKL